MRPSFFAIAVPRRGCDPPIFPRGEAVGIVKCPKNRNFNLRGNRLKQEVSRARAQRFDCK